LREGAFQEAQVHIYERLPWVKLFYDSESDCDLQFDLMTQRPCLLVGMDRPELGRIAIVGTDAERLEWARGLSDDGQAQEPGLRTRRKLACESETLVLCNLALAPSWYLAGSHQTLVMREIPSRDSLGGSQRVKPAN